MLSGSTRPGYRTVPSGNSGSISVMRRPYAASSRAPSRPPHCAEVQYLRRRPASALVVSHGQQPQQSGPGEASPAAPAATATRSQPRDAGLGRPGRGLAGRAGPGFGRPGYAGRAGPGGARRAGPGFGRPGRGLAGRAGPGFGGPGRAGVWRAGPGRGLPGRAGLGGPG